MSRFLFATAVALGLGVLLCPSTRAADPKKPDAAKPVEFQIFEKLLAQHKDMTFEQLHGRAVKPRDYRESLSFDPTKAAHFDTLKTKFALTDDEIAIFKKQGFVSLDLNRRYSFASAYYQIYTADLPVFVSTDSIMHVLHKSYDEILMDMEMNLFLPAIQEVLARVHDELGKREMDKTDVNVLDVDLYLTVARNLLVGAGSPAGEVDARGQPVWNGALKIASKFGQDAAVLALIEEVKSLRLHHPFSADPQSQAPIRIYGGERYLDFSQFKPRGHYTKYQPLKHYFRCMMWLGRVDCGWNVLPTEATPGVKADSARELRNAVLFCELLRATNGVKPLKGLDDIIGFMVGRSDNLGVFTMLDIMKVTEVQTLADARNGDNLKKLQDEIASGKHAAQMIRSQLVFSDPQNTIKTPPPGVFQVFGQRFIIDSFVLSQVVFDSIIFKNQKQERKMPMGLDAVAALGNDEALKLLEPELRKWNYSANLMASRDFVNMHPAAYWKSNLYNLWLDCLRTLHADMSKENRFPEAMKTKTWQMKQLQTQLGSWAELRHDTILYAKQSYTAGVMCEYPAGYVEPYPEFYAKVRFFAEEAARLFTAADFTAVAPPDNAGVFKQRQASYTAFYKRMGETMGQLETLAKKELAGEAFTDAEKLFLKKTVDVRGGGSGPPRYDGWYCFLFFRPTECRNWDPTVADVHTDPDSSSVLQVAVGDANLGIIAIDNDGDKMVYVGPLYSYYEFRQPADKRLTDQEWQKMIETDKLPPRPDWTKDFVAPKRKPGPMPR